MPRAHGSGAAYGPRLTLPSESLILGPMLQRISKIDRARGMVRRIVFPVVCLCIIFSWGCDENADSSSSPTAGKAPVCTPFSQKIVAGTECANDNMCREFGYCGDVQGRCWPTTKNHCACSTRCKTMGACSLRKIPQGERRLHPGRTHICGAVNAKDCKQSDGCKFKERCTLAKGGNCVKG